MNPDLIPLELRSLPQWVVWRAEDRSGKTTKIPYSPSGTPASVTDSSTWCSIDAAAQVAPQFSGFGFVLTEGGGLACIDVDHAISPEGVVSPWVIDLVESFDSFTELSPSGSGLHVWFQISESLPGRKFSAKRLREAGFDARDGEALEVYTQGRYLTVTGQPFQRYRPLRHCDRELRSLLQRLSPPATQTAQQPPCVVNSSHNVTGDYNDDYSLLQKAFESKRGHEVRALWIGNISGEQSHSEADLSLCSHLAFWLDRDPVRIDAMFRRSGLFRSKWDTRRGATTYGAQTIAKAIAGCTEVYSGPVNGRPKRTDHTGVSYDRDETSRDEAEEAIEREAISYQPFPVSTLPEPLRGFVEASAASLDVPTEWIAFPLLASIGSAWGGWVQLKEGFREPVNLWFCGLGSPSSAKSPSLRSALEPIQRIDSELHAKREEAQEEFVRDLDRFSSRKKGEFAQRPERVLIPQILVSNATTESIVPVCQVNPRIPLLFADELSGLFASFNQYRGGRGSDCEFFLSSFSGASHSVNRMGRDPVHLKSLRLSICGFSTPGAFKSGLGEGAASLVQRGFLGRFILSMPPHRVRKFSEEPIQSALVDKIERLLRNVWGGPSGVLEVATQAKEDWVRFFDQTQRKSVTASEALGFHYGKLPGIVLRIAGILCMTRGGSKITDEDMDCALRIGAWIENETVRAYALLNVSQPPAHSVLMEYLKTHPGVTARDVSRLGPRSLRRAGSEKIETWLRGLKESGLVRSEFPSGAGRPGERWFAIGPEEEPAEPPEPGGDECLGMDDYEDAFEALLDLAPPPSDGLPELAAEEVLDSEAIASLRRRFTGSSI